MPGLERAAARSAVEEHLATRAECQEAFAMYRRFSTLLRSPLRLGAPSAHFGEGTPMVAADTPQSRLGWHPGGSGSRGPRNRRALAGGAAVLAATLVIAGFLAALAPRLHLAPVSGTPSAQPSASAQSTRSTTPQPTATTPPQPTGTPQPPSAFVCANPQGSNLTYAYVRGDGRPYSVTGCATPKRLTSTTASPIAWSPSNRYLAVMLDTFPEASHVVAIDPQTGAQISTGLDEDFGSEPTVGSTGRIFFGWLDDNTILGAIAPLVDGPDYAQAPGTATLVRVDLRTGKETTIGTIPGWVSINFYRPGANVRIVANGRYLFYAAYEGSTAYLHRFDLPAGVDTKLVSLGLYGNGGCQGTTVCGWSAPWDVSPDGNHILYHHPGPTSTPSDINTPKDTPVVYASPDGSGASSPFGTQLAAGLVTPVFSLSGALAVTTGSTYVSPVPATGMAQMKLVAFGSPATIVPGSLNSWRGDNRALVVFDTQTGGHSLYDLGSGKTTPLEANSFAYVWGN